MSVMKHWKAPYRLMLLLTIVSAAVSCTRQKETTSNLWDIDSLNGEKRLSESTEPGVSNTIDTIDQHYANIEREFSHLEGVRKEQDRVLAERINREELLSNEAVYERSEGHFQKQQETALRYEMQTLEDAAVPKMNKVENALANDYEGSSRAEVSRLLKELWKIRERQLDIAYELGDERMIEGCEKELRRVSLLLSERENARSSVGSAGLGLGH